MSSTPWRIRCQAALVIVGTPMLLGVLICGFVIGYSKHSFLGMLVGTAAVGGLWLLSCLGLNVHDYEKRRAIKTGDPCWYCGREHKVGP